MDAKASPAVSPAVYFFDPAEHKPPLGAKILLLTEQRTCVIGTWGHGMIGWQFLPRIPASLKR